MSKLLKHPTGQKRFQVLAARFLELQRQHRCSSDALWTGMLASSFTDEELNILKSYTSPHDVRLLKQVRQPQKTEKSNERNTITTTGI